MFEVIIKIVKYPLNTIAAAHAHPQKAHRASRSKEGPGRHDREKKDSQHTPHTSPCRVFSTSPTERNHSCAPGSTHNAEARIITQRTVRHGAEHAVLLVIFPAPVASITHYFSPYRARARAGCWLEGRAVETTHAAMGKWCFGWRLDNATYASQPANQPKGKQNPLPPPKAHAQPASPSAVCTIQSISHREPGTTTAVILAHTAKLLFANGSGNDRGVAVVD